MQVILTKSAENYIQVEIFSGRKSCKCRCTKTPILVSGHVGSVAVARCPVLPFPVWLVCKHRNVSTRLLFLHHCLSTYHQQVVSISSFPYLFFGTSNQNADICLEGKRKRSAFPSACASHRSHFVNCASKYFIVSSVFKGLALQFFHFCPISSVKFHINEARLFCGI